MPTYSCPNDSSCGFGQNPDRCKHGEWIRSGATASNAGPTRVKISRELAAKLLGLRGQPAPQNVWLRNVAPVETVKARYRADAEKVSAAKAKSAVTLLPPGPSLVDPETGVLVSAAAYWARNP